MELPVRGLQIGMTHNIGGMETYLMVQYRKLNREIVRYDFLNITGESQIVFSDEIEHNGDSCYGYPKYNFTDGKVTPVRLSLKFRYIYL